MPKDWRKVREEMEHERYIQLRRMGHELNQWAPEMKLREEARRYANECCRMAIAQQNEITEV